MILAHQIKQFALSLGFHACGIARADYLEEDAGRLKVWLQDQRHGEMNYMENHFIKRVDPRNLVDQARSVIVVLYNYFPDQNLPVDNNYRVSKYAYGIDYHLVIKEKLKKLVAHLETLDKSVNARAFVDSAPVLERSWAARAGLGWIGKNTCLITKKQGSYFFIGEVITNLELETDEKMVPNHCGGCTRCLEACPTHALDKNGLDARKCISYWTIEYKGEEISEELRGKFHDWIFGCDICQEVCPWNRLSEPHHEPAFKLSEQLAGMRKTDWEDLTEHQFRQLFRNSPLHRAKFNGLKRNVEFVQTEISR